MIVKSPIYTYSLRMILLSFKVVQIGQVISKEKIFVKSCYVQWKMEGWQLPSDVKSSHCLWSGKGVLWPKFSKSSDVGESVLCGKILNCQGSSYLKLSHYHKIEIFLLKNVTIQMKCYYPTCFIFVQTFQKQYLGK